MKKFAALMMTLAMVLALAVPALASATPSTPKITDSAASLGSAGGFDAEYSGTTNVPTLNVTVSYTAGYSSSKGSLVLNPYQTSNTTIHTAGSTEQVISSPIEIINSTADCGVEVIVKAPTAKFEGGMVSASKPIDNTKQVSVPTAYLVIYGGNAPTDKAPAEFNKANQVLITDQASTAAAIVTTVPKNNGKKYVLIGGSLATNMKLDADSFWTTSTKVTDVSYTLMIRAEAPAATSSST